MPNFFQKIPSAFAICVSTLICSAVVMLQNADSYAERLEIAASTLSTESGELMRYVAGLLGMQKLNKAEHRALRSLSHWADPEEHELPETDAVEEDAPAEKAAPSQQASVPTRAETPQPTPEKKPHHTKPKRKTIPAPSSKLWAAFNTPLTREDTLAARFHGNVPTGHLLLRRTKAADATPADATPEPPAKPAEPSTTPEPPAKPAEPSTTPEPPAKPAEPSTTPEPPAKPAEPDTTPEPPVKPAEPDTTPEPPAKPAEPDTTPEPPAKPAEPQEVLTQAPPMRYRIMMVGDSLMEDLGPRAYRAYSNRKGMEFVVSAKFSTGLCRPQTFNWPEHMRAQVAKYPPDLVIFFIGANDAMPIREGKRVVPLGGAPWREAYMRKMDELVSIARDAGAEVIWVELPAVGNRYGAALRDNQIAQREYCENTGTLSVQTDELFSGVWGKYDAYAEFGGKKVRVRRADKAHLTSEGNMKIIECLQPMIESCMLSCYAAQPDRQLTEKEQQSIKKVPLILTCRSTPAPKPAAPAPEKTPAPAPSQPTR